MVLILFLASCSKDESSVNPPPPPPDPPKTNELTVVVHEWQTHILGTYTCIFTNLLGKLNWSTGKVSVYANVNGEYKQLTKQPIYYNGGTLSASVSEADLSITFQGNPYSGPPQSLMIKVVVED